MLAIYRFLFPSKPDGTTISLLLLALRILFGGLLLTHGIQKWTVPPGYDPDDLYHVYGIFRYSR